MLYFALFLAFTQAIFAQQGDIQVNTTEGVVQGAMAADGKYYTFYGLHYGGNTAGANRFKAPTPAPSYPGVFIAHDSSVICAQPNIRGIIGKEDCLTLNVFTNDTTVPKPVLVWLTGEEYTTSDEPGNSFRKLVLEGVVVIQLNYRLSIFGFLCLGVEEAPGNAGLKDIVQGLKWVKTNIAGFGGNPNNVILFGHGSGAAMVDLLTMSPLAKDLFHKVIVQSGSALAPWAISYNPIEHAHAFGAKFGYTSKSNQELAQHLITTDISLIGNALNEFVFHNNSILFAPCIENVKLNPNDTFLADAPLNLLRNKQYIDVPYIAGYTDKEGTMRAEQAAYGQWLDKMQANFTEFLPVDLNFGNNLASVEKSIREFYFAQRSINMDTIEDFLDYQGDTLVLVSVVRAARERSLTSSSEVRIMEFAHMGTANSNWAFSTIPLNGARHGIVLNYLLDNDLKPTDIPVQTSLIQRFLAFFNTGSPNYGTAITWPAVSNASLSYLMYSGGDPAVYSEEQKTNPHSQRMTFWNDIYFKYYVAPKPVSSSVRILGVFFIVFVSQVVVSLF